MHHDIIFAKKRLIQRLSISIPIIKTIKSFFLFQLVHFILLIFGRRVEPSIVTLVALVYSYRLVNIIVVMVQPEDHREQSDHAWIIFGFLRFVIFHVEGKLELIKV